MSSVLDPKISNNEHLCKMEKLQKLCICNVHKILNMHKNVVCFFLNKLHESRLNSLKEPYFRVISFAYLYLRHFFKLEQ